MIATGRPMKTSRRMPPPTAEQTPTNTAGTGGSPSASALLVPNAPNIPITIASSPTMMPLSLAQRRREQHPDQRRPGGGEQIPVALQRAQRLIEQHVADDAAAHAHHDADDRDTQQVEPALTAEARREQSALDAAESHRREVRPERDHEEGSVHVPILSHGSARVRWGSRRP